MSDITNSAAPLPVDDPKQQNPAHGLRATGWTGEDSIALKGGLIRTIAYIEDLLRERP